MPNTLIPQGAPQGPNSNTRDHVTVIADDPYFAGWFNPIPQWWFLSALDYPNLSAPGGPPTNEFSHFYQAFAVDDLNLPPELYPDPDVWPDPDEFPGIGLRDSADGFKNSLRQAVESLVTSDSVTRDFTGGRDLTDSIPFGGDSATAQKVDFDPVPDIVRPVVEPVWDPGDIE